MMTTTEAAPESKTKSSEQAPPRFEYYLITNVGTMLHSYYAQTYPRQLVLAQLYAQSAAYQEACKRIRRSTCRLILDNGAHEGQLVDSDSYLKVIRELCPDVVVLPDLIGAEWQDSMATSLNYVDVLRKAWPYGFKAGNNVDLMLACQGRTRDETLEAYAFAIKNLDPDKYIIGFGQSYLAWLDNPDQQDLELQRIKLIEAVMSMSGADKHRFHILGGRWTPTDSYSRFPNIIGLDSVKPCACTVQGTTYPEKPRKKMNLLDQFVAHAGTLRFNIVTFCEAYGMSYA